MVPMMGSRIVPLDAGFGAQRPRKVQMRRRLLVISTDRACRFPPPVRLPVVSSLQLSRSRNVWVTLAVGALICMSVVVPQGGQKGPGKCHFGVCGLPGASAQRLTDAHTGSDFELLGDERDQDDQLQVDGLGVHVAVKSDEGMLAGEGVGDGAAKRGRSGDQAEGAAEVVPVRVRRCYARVVFGDDGAGLGGGESMASEGIFVEPVNCDGQQHPGRLAGRTDEHAGTHSDNSEAADGFESKQGVGSGSLNRDATPYYVLQPDVLRSGSAQLLSTTRKYSSSVRSMFMGRVANLPPAPYVQPIVVSFGQLVHHGAALHVMHTLRGMGIRATIMYDCKPSLLTGDLHTQSTCRQGEGFGPSVIDPDYPYQHSLHIFLHRVRDVAMARVSVEAKTLHVADGAGSFPHYLLYLTRQDPLLWNLAAMKATGRAYHDLTPLHHAAWQTLRLAKDVILAQPAPMHIELLVKLGIVPHTTLPLAASQPPEQQSASDVSVDLFLRGRSRALHVAELRDCMAVRLNGSAAVVLVLHPRPGTPATAAAEQIHAFECSVHVDQRVATTMEIQQLVRAVKPQRVAITPDNDASDSVLWPTVDGLLNATTAFCSMCVIPLLYESVNVEYRPIAGSRTFLDSLFLRIVHNVSSVAADWQQAQYQGFSIASGHPERRIYLPKYRIARHTDGRSVSEEVTIASPWRNRSALVADLIKKRGHRRYLEIGCKEDDTFSLVKGLQLQRHVGVDPQQGGTHRMTSDEFFAQNTETFDVVFVDGLHEHRQALRDVLNALRVLSPDGVIVMHDCNPRSEHEAAYPYLEAIRMHNGDVWRAVVDLRLRHDIDVAVGEFDNGCGVIRPRPAAPPLVMHRADGSPLNNSLELTFGDFDAVREDILQLKTYDDLLQWAYPA